MHACRAIHGAATIAVLVLLCPGAACSQAPRPDGGAEPPTADSSERAAEPRAAQKPLAKDAKILFLHHSTGECIWNGGVEAWFDAYNRAHGTKYKIARQAFPKSEPYGWANYPYDYWNIGKYRYMAMRVRADRKMAINVTLVTEGDRADDSSFGFTAYVELPAGKWTQVVLDLTKLELNAEGEKAYAAAGKPTRPKELTCLKLVTAEKNAGAAVAIDDIAFYVTLPGSIAESAPQR